MWRKSWAASSWTFFPWVIRAGGRRSAHSGCLSRNPCFLNGIWSIKGNGLLSVLMFEREGRSLRIYRYINPQTFGFLMPSTCCCSVLCSGINVRVRPLQEAQTQSFVAVWKLFGLRQQWSRMSQQLFVVLALLLLQEALRLLTSAVWTHLIKLYFGYICLFRVTDCIQSWWSMNTNTEHLTAGRILCEYYVCCMLYVL